MRGNSIYTKEIRAKQLKTINISPWDSNKLHQSYGAGLWAYFIEPSYLENITVANSSEELSFCISIGYTF